MVSIFNGQRGRISMSRILRKVYLWIVAVFWSRRYSLTSIIASSLSLQAFACTYGTPDDSNSGPFQDLTPTGCQPVFELQTNTDTKASTNYSNCEQEIIDQLALAEKAKNKYGENSDIFVSQWNASLETSREIAETCDMKQLKADGTLKAYICEGRTISVEEAERLRAEDEQGK